MALYPDGERPCAPGLEIGKHSDIGAFTLINARFGVRVGKDVQIGPHCAILSDDSIGGNAGPIRIGKGARIGAHCTILPNVSIGAGALVGAHSLVPSGTTIKAREFWAGAPATRRIR